MAFKTSNLEELILPLRIQIGDSGSTPTYSDETLHAVLRESVSALMTRWDDKYIVDNDGVVRRNSSYGNYSLSSPPVIQRSDRRPIVLQASIMIKGGEKFSGASSVASWRDEEISYSNIESAKQISATLADDIKELEALLPSNKLARPIYGSLYGWKEDYS